MKLNWKRHLLIAGVACSSLFASAFAEEECHPQPKPVCDVPCGTPPAGQIGDYCEFLPDAGPHVCDGADVFIIGTFIWWNARQEGLSYVSSNYNTGFSSSNEGESRGSVSKAFESWDPGFKIGLGYNLPHDGWDIYAEYTWLKSSDRSSSTRASDVTGQLLPMWNVNQGFTNFTPSSTDFISKASAHFRNRLNVVDVEIGRNFFTSQHLALRPFWGFKGTWQKQDYRVRYEHTQTDGDVTTTHLDRIINDQDYWAVGLRTGMDSTYHFNDSFSLYGDFALSALWAYYDIDRKDTQDSDINDPVNLVVTSFSTENDYSVGKAVFEMEIGLRWETWFSNDDYHFMVQAGWEHQIWFSHNNLFHYFEECAHGDMTYMGLDVKLRFDF